MWNKSRVIADVLEVRCSGPIIMVTLRIPQWKQDLIRTTADLFPSGVRAKVRTGAQFMVMVNLQAGTVLDLDFEDFEPRG